MTTLNKQQILLKLKKLIKDGNVVDIYPLDKLKFIDDKYVVGKFKFTKSRISKTFKVVERDNFKCVGCGLNATHIVIVKNGYSHTVKAYNIEDVNNPVLFTKDHIIPRSNSGNNQYFNLQCHCVICNSNKSNNTSFEDLVSFHKKQNEYLEAVNKELSIKLKEMNEKTKSHDILKKKYNSMKERYDSQLDIMEELEDTVNTNKSIFNFSFRKNIETIIKKFNKTLG